MPVDFLDSKRPKLGTSYMAQSLFLELRKYQPAMSTGFAAEKKRAAETKQSMSCPMISNGEDVP